MKDTRFLVFTLIIYFCLSFWAIAQDVDSTRTEADRFYQQATEFHNNGDFAKAIERYTKTIQVDSNYINAFWFRAILFGELENYPSAIADLRKVNQLAPEFGSAFGSLGWYLIWEGEFLEAREPTEKALELVPESMTWTINLGHTYLLTGDTTTAAEYYRKTLLLISSEAAFTNGPLADFQIFIENGWQVAMAQQYLAWFQNQFELSVKYYIEADSLFRQARELHDKQQYLEAAQQFAEAAKTEEMSKQTRSQDLASTLNWAGYCYKTAGDYKTAEPLYQRALTIFEEVLGPNHPDVATSLNKLAALYSFTGGIQKENRFFNRRSKYQFTPF